MTAAVELSVQLSGLFFYPFLVSRARALALTYYKREGGLMKHKKNYPIVRVCVCVCVYTLLALFFFYNTYVLCECVCVYVESCTQPPPLVIDAIVQ